MSSIFSRKILTGVELNTKVQSHPIEILGYNIDTSKCYGDIDSKSGVDSVEVYNEILERKEYNLESSDFNYSIDATKDVDYVIEKAKEIAKDISLKNIDNK